MTTVAYIANEFPSPLEPYVMDEIAELRRSNVQVICCSGKRVSPNDLSLAERAFWKETHYFQPLSDDQLRGAARRLARDRRALWQLLRPIASDGGASISRHIRTLGHTVMGATLAEQLAPLEVEHIHAHHGYFASWMALTAARLLGIGFSLTLHGSDLLQRADLLSAKLRACEFCVTVSDYNRRYILRNYPEIPAEKIVVQRLGVDGAHSRPTAVPVVEADHRRFCLLAVGRLHRVKDYRFLIQACAELRSRGLDLLCWIVGEGPERRALEHQIAALGLEKRVTVQGLDWQRAKWGWMASRILHWGEAAAVRAPNATMVVSRTLQKHFRQQHKRDTVYVPNGATPVLRRPGRQLLEWDLVPDNYILFLGRFSPEKNCHLLIDAFKNQAFEKLAFENQAFENRAIEKLDTSMKLVLAGGSNGASSHSDAYAESLRRHASDRIRFLPWVSGSDLEELLANAALFVLPSELEGLSLALLDAMAAGVCVLTSDIPENKEVVENAGYTFCSGDQADLERMLHVLIHNPELRRQSAARARRRIDGQYLWPAIARSIEATYYDVLGWSRNEERAEKEIPVGVSAIATAPLRQIPSA